MSTPPQPTDPAAPLPAGSGQPLPPSDPPGSKYYDVRLAVFSVPLLWLFDASAAAWVVWGVFVFLVIIIRIVWALSAYA
ncbi:hypothetical protein [Rhodococcus marinonascens]|uniref:hypothetical protein n=1 Tax=Rhodococcus marinonascens TaxID=38311 RepID=UPI000B095EB8|nr:hypothetical protein [Rhodococcus marinonascens]